MKKIEFAPNKPTGRKRRSSAKSRTGILLTMIMRPQGAKVSEIAKAFEDTKGVDLAPNKIAATWIVPSYLADKGIGVVSKVLDDGKDLLVKGYEYGQAAPPINGGPADKKAAARKAPAAKKRKAAEKAAA